MWNKILLIIILLANTLLLSAQNNLIHNGSFEDSNGAPTLEGQFKPRSNVSSVYPEVWECDIYEDNLLNHSPDWYDINTPVCNVRATSSNGGAKTGNRYAGMHDYEILEQQFFNGQELNSGDAYVFTAYFQFSDYKINDPQPYQNSGSTLKVYLGKTKLEYEDNDENEECKQGYVEFNNGLLQSIREVVSIPLSTSIFPLGGGWYKISQLFVAPSGHDILGFEADVYDWVGIQLENQSYSDQGQGTSCFKSYILLDDISIAKYCDHVCAPQLPAITHGTLPLTMNGALWNYTYKFLMENVMGFEFEVYGRWSGGVPVYHFNVFSSTGLKDPGYNDYLFVWNGHNDQGNGLQQGTYDIWMRMWNCNEDYVWNNYALFIDAGHNIIYPYALEAANYTLPECNCEAQKYIQNKIFTVPTNINSSDFIISGQSVTSGTNGPVLIQSTVNFTANDYIDLYDGFDTDNSNFSAQIAQCESFHRKRDYSSRENSIDSSPKVSNCKVYPNPSIDGNFTLESSFISKKTKVMIRNTLGTIVKQYNFNEDNNSSFELSISDLAPGAYYVSMEVENNYFHDKIIFIRR
ncbi:MAG: T9SS type A sorting domain-containing protein [Bacteroidota bacterium]